MEDGKISLPVELSVTETLMGELRFEWIVSNVFLFHRGQSKLLFNPAQYATITARKARRKIRKASFGVI
jgi:hypothetical protein